MKTDSPLSSWTFVVGEGAGSTTVKLSCVGPGRIPADALPCTGVVVTAVTIFGGATLGEAVLEPFPSCNERSGLVRFHM